MPEKDSERLTGETIEAQDQAGIAAVRLELKEKIRINKGLPSELVNLDVDILSKLSNTPKFDAEVGVEEPSSRIIDITKIPAEYNVVGLTTRQRRVEKLREGKKDKAA